MIKQYIKKGDNMKKITLLLVLLSFQCVNAAGFEPVRPTQRADKYRVGDKGPSGGLVLSILGNSGVEAAPFDLDDYYPEHPEFELTWVEAKEYLRNHWDHNQHLDWRLPSIAELMRIKDLQDSGLETNMKESLYWSDTTFYNEDDEKSAYIYSFYPDEYPQVDSWVKSRPLFEYRPVFAGYKLSTRPVRRFTWVNHICDHLDNLSNEDKKDFVDILSIEERNEIQNSECSIEYNIGDVGPAGGWVFSVNEEGSHGLEAAPEDIRGQWFCHYKSLEGNALRRGLGEGKENTLDMIEYGCLGVASTVDKYAVNGYDDWYLPSHGELDLMYSNINEIGNFQKTGGRLDTMYWTSTTNEIYQNSLRFSYIRDFRNGWSNLAEKTFNFRARPTREF